MLFRSAADVTVKLKRIYDPDARGWRNGNTHIHLRKLDTEEMRRHLREIPRADGLDVAFLSHLERADDDRWYSSNKLTKKDLEALSGAGVLFGNGQEHRHNFAGYGEGYGTSCFSTSTNWSSPSASGPAS